ncbi:MarR family winged helix-turn-helix transcriptional regulator [Microbispora sp. KK1-11]|uniref:MarR family winged helix-turn-helix transcriptional regulator n=1 Tax=Microbispora sp. KK1-11 TaxID=2053005 RepID=UPI001C8D6792|nr:MarR family transcriptional regulator [Microbispora sp. KK1-11]
MTTTTTTKAGTESTFATALVRMSHVVQYVFADVSREHGVTPQQAQLLCVLTGGPIGMTELSRLLHLEKSSLTGLVDRVERRGFVTRVSHPRDRRACRISLTPEGARLGEKVHEEICARLDVLGEEMPEADRLRIATALTGVVARYAT